ncbi:MAG: polyphosphate:AMP phosphotransferase [Proteobacteria bacterium]|nr:polyphosphate:AMP phosphotransferase [Pseudomonadota bacterium]
MPAPEKRQPIAGSALDRLRSELLDAQFDLQRGKGFSVIVIATGLVAAGRTEALTALRDWLDPKRLATHAWGLRDDEEAARPWAFRYWQALPRRGEMAVWFDGWYGDLFHLAYRRRKDHELEQRAAQINSLEIMLTADGVRLLKWHFDIEQAMQRKRVRKLRGDELNRWRVTDEDLRLCRHYQRVVQAHERCQNLTDHAGASWRRFRDAYEGRQAVPLARELLAALRAQPDVPVPRHGRAPAGRPAAAGRIRSATASRPSRMPEQELPELQSRLAHRLQSKRFRKHSLVIVLEGMDAAGKSSASKRVIATMDPRQYRIVPIGAPTDEERSYPYLRRFWCALPGRGEVGIFDRSWYGRVLVERVRGFATTSDWSRAYAEILEMEREFIEHRIVLAKFWFALSKAEQGRRFERRRAQPLKRFKVDPEDWENRKHWDEFQTAAADMLALTHTQHAPWMLLPADDKPQARAALLRGLIKTLDRRLEDG